MKLSELLRIKEKDKMPRVIVKSKRFDEVLSEEDLENKDVRYLMDNTNLTILGIPTTISISDGRKILSQKGKLVVAFGYPIGMGACYNPEDLNLESPADKALESFYVLRESYPRDFP